MKPDAEEQELIENTGGELLDVILAHLKHILANIFGEPPELIADILSTMPDEKIKSNLAEIGFEVTGHVGLALDALRKRKNTRIRKSHSPTNQKEN